MGFLSGKKYRQCKQNDDGSLDCISYRPTKDSKKIVTASIRAIQTQDCKTVISEVDGDPSDIADLEEYLGKKARNKCNKAQSE